jgi:hypothetical protein
VGANKGDNKYFNSYLFEQAIGQQSGHQQAKFEGMYKESGCQQRRQQKL